MRAKLFFGFSILIFIFLLGGCKKKKEDTSSNPASPSVDTSLTSSRNEIYAESFYDDVCTMGEELSTSTLNLFRQRQNSSPLCGCASIYYDTLNHWKNVTINFGT